MELAFKFFGTSIKAGIWSSEMAPTFPVQTMNQVHGTDLVEMVRYETAPQADALFTLQPHLRLAVKTADCIPLIFADETLPLVAAVHAGWRGLTAGIIPKTLAELEKRGVNMARLKVGIGPSLGSSCAHFSKPFEEIPEAYHWAITKQASGGTVDLNGIALKQLLDAGLLKENIKRIELCTHCDPTWPSWRRDQTSRRLLTWIEWIG